MQLTLSCSNRVLTPEPYRSILYACMNTIRFTFTTFIVFSLFLVSIKPIDAAVRCEAQYGGGQVCVTTGELQINKKVFCNPAKEADKVCEEADSEGFVDNLGINHTFVPGEEIRFKLFIKNVGNAAFSKVTVTDTLPAHLERVSGDLTFEITDLTPGETETREIRTRVAGADKFPSDKSLVCEVNVAEAKSDSQSDRDSSQVCLERKILGVKQLPKAGVEDWVLPLFGGLIVVGFIVRKQLTNN